MNDIFGLLISGLLIGLVLFFASTVPIEKDEDHTIKKKKDDNDEDFNIAIS